ISYTAKPAPNFREVEVTVNVLVLENFAEAYRDRLIEQFPGIAIHTAQCKSEIRTNLSCVDVLIAFGIAIDDDLMQGASALRWVQSVGTGVVHFLACSHRGAETILTSARGIHGPPMGERVAYLMLSSARDAPRLYRDQAARRWDRGEPWTLLAEKTAVLAGV